MSEKKSKKKAEKANSKFAIVDDHGEILRTEKTLPKAVEWINSCYDADESVDFAILEIVSVHELKANKVDAEQMPLDEYVW